MEERRKIGLIGFSASGKSSIAHIAARDGFSVVDSDRYIEDREGLDIPAIFEKYGEECFRELESQYIPDLLSGDFEVISFGGGVLYSHPVFKTIAESDIHLIYIRESFEVLMPFFDPERLPLYNDLKVSGFRDLYEKRSDDYLKACDFLIDRKGREPFLVWQEVKELWNLVQS